MTSEDLSHAFFDRGNSAGGTTSISWRQILSYSHQGLAAFCTAAR